MGGSSIEYKDGSTKYGGKLLLEESFLDTDEIAVSSLNKGDRYPIGRFLTNKYLKEFDYIDKGDQLHDIKRKEYLGDKTKCCLLSTNFYWTNEKNEVYSENRSNDTPYLVTCNPSLKINPIECIDILTDSCINHNSECERLFSFYNKKINDLMFKVCQYDYKDYSKQCNLWLRSLRISDDSTLNLIADNILISQKNKKNFPCVFPPKDIKDKQNEYPLECWYEPCIREPIEKLTTDNIKKRRLCSNVDCDINVKDFNISSTTKIKLLCNNTTQLNYSEILYNKNYEFKNTFLLNIHLELTIILIILFLLFWYYDRSKYSLFKFYIRRNYKIY